MKVHKIVIMLLAAGAMIVSCQSTPTAITGTWHNQNIPTQEYKTIMVVGLTENVRAKAVVEDDIARKLEQNGIHAIKSIEVFPPSFTDSQTDKAKILQRVKENGADAILTVSLIDKETETRYVPGSYGYQPMPRYGFYGMFWPYYSYMYPRLYSPGYYEEDKVYFLETNLYDAKTEQIIWSGQSETYNPKTLEEFSKDFSTRIVKRLESDNILM